MRCYRSVGLCTKVGSGSVTQRSAPEEHDVYSLAVFMTPRSGGAQCGVGSIYIPLLTERNSSGAGVL